jgi:two-component system nitrogen regulation response regulator NtrX
MSRDMNAHIRATRVLIVDDEPGIRASLAGVLEYEGYSCHAVGSGEECLAALAIENYEAVLLDVWLPGMDGLETLARIQELPFTARPEVVIISGHGTIETAVKATKLGAFDFLEKPLTIGKVTVVLNNAIQQRRLELELSRLREAGETQPQIIGDSVPMKALRQQLSLMAATNGRVLIFGESGTGKELIAHAIHAASARRSDAFVEVNCAAIPEELIESELFGHRKGSFAGALEDKIGKLQKAHGGTLFLDEVGDMSLKTQAKVLRSLEEQRFEPVGAAESIQVDVRVVASTNKNLEEEIERGNFREDLFYRLNVIPFHVPPLRERVEDVRLLANHFLKEFTTAYGRKPKELTDEALRVLEEYSWPGNVRELRNLMERIVIMNPQTRVDARHIPLDRARRAALDRPMDRFGSLQEVREAAERDYILKKLEDAKGNVTRAAEMLGLERSHLYRKMKALGIALKESATGVV